MWRVEAIGAPMSGAEERHPEIVEIPVNQVVLQHYDREHLALRRYLVCSSVDEATAEEIVQETFLKLHRHLSRSGDRSNLRGWIYRVARNLALNEHASARRRRGQAIEDCSCEDCFASDHDSPEVQFLQNELETQLRQAMRKLSEAQCECLVLRAQGMKYREIADVLDISVASVGENIQRGLGKLKELL
ncbi:MAG: sigma-70 family RNA polymerase sigma factor [Bryobacteraceae bacterium]